MKNTPVSQHGAYDYAEHIRARLPGQLQEAREAVGLSQYGLAIRAGVSRDMIRDIERGESIPTLFLAARLAFALGMTLARFIARLENRHQ